MKIMTGCWLKSRTLFIAACMLLNWPLPSWATVMALAGGWAWAVKAPSRVIALVIMVSMARMVATNRKKLRHSGRRFLRKRVRKAAGWLALVRLFGK